MKETYRLAAALVIVIAIAGCTGPGGGGGGDDGDTSSDFKMTPNDALSLAFTSLSSTYTEDDQIVLQLEAQNTGQKKAVGINTALYGASFLVGDSVTPSPALATSLQGVDQAAKQPGGSSTAVWRVPNPINLNQGATQRFPAGVRVQYNYSTEASASFTVVPRNKFEGGSSAVTTDNTAGPVKASVDVNSPKPVSQPTGDATMTEFTVPVTIRNVGDGKVADINENKWDMAMDVSFQSAGSAANVVSCGGTKQKNLPHTFQLFDRSRKVICTVKVKPDLFETQLTLNVNLDYPYVESRETSFTIEGLSGDQSPG